MTHFGGKGILTGLVIMASGSSWSQSTLRDGPFKVGFKQQWHFDYGRTYQMHLKGGGSYAKGKAPRPILMNLWYPAAPKNGATQMTRPKYLNFAKGPSDIKNWLSAFQIYNRDVIRGEITGAAWKDLKAPQRAAFERFQNSSTRAFWGATPAKGTFPVVFYHQGNGSSIEDNTEFCEFLAGNGYIVVNSSYLAGDGTSFNVDSSTGSADDIRFLTAYLRTQPNVDWRKIGMIGHSGGAHTALKYLSVPGGALDAVVSLDTTQDYYSLHDPRWTFVRHDVLPNLDRLTTPIMMVANPYAIFELADKFTRADRHYLTVELGHNEFISQGVQRLRFLAAAGETPKKEGAAASLARVETSYRAMCEFILHFFDAKLKAQATGFRKLEDVYSRSTIGGKLPHVEVAPKGAVTISPFDSTRGVNPHRGNCGLC